MMGTRHKTPDGYIEETDNSHNDIRPPKDGAVFYTNNGRDAARDYAAKLRADGQPVTTLEQTPHGRKLDGDKLFDRSDPDTNQMELDEAARIREETGKISIDKHNAGACRKVDLVQELLLVCMMSWRLNYEDATMILNVFAEKMRQDAKDDFKGRHFKASLILQAVGWYLRYPLSYRNLEEMFLERGLSLDHSTINRWVLTYAPLLEKRLRRFRKVPCGSYRIDETYVRIKGRWRFLYRAIDKHGNPVDSMLTAKRDADAAKRFFRKSLKEMPLLAPDRIGTDGDRALAAAVKDSENNGFLPNGTIHYVTKYLQQGIESDHFVLKQPFPRSGGFQSFNTARQTIKGFEAMLWLRKGLGFCSKWSIHKQNEILALCFGLQKLNNV